MWVTYKWKQFGNSIVQDKETPWYGRSMQMLNKYNSTNYQRILILKHYIS